jgi:hypothetical protein
LLQKSSSPYISPAGGAIEIDFSIKPFPGSTVITVNKSTVFRTVTRFRQDSHTSRIPARSWRTSWHINQLSRNKRQALEIAWLLPNSERQWSTSQQTKEITVNQSKQLDVLLEQIAKEHLSIETLETMNSDRCDFHDVAVWSIKSALAAAYAAGVSAKLNKSTTLKDKK